MFLVGQQKAVIWQAYMRMSLQLIFNELQIVIVVVFFNIYIKKLRVCSFIQDQLILIEHPEITFFM
jgi:hypothetical protein